MLEVREKLNKIICLFLEEKINYDDVVKYTKMLMPISEACELADELEREVFMALWHGDEKYCNVPKEEMIYYKKCFDGKDDFSADRRDAIIRKSLIV